MSSTTAALPGDAPASASAPPAPAPAAAARPPAYPPLTGSQLVLGTIALSLATFMNVLDSSIANVSIPAISGDLGVSPTQGTDRKSTRLNSSHIQKSRMPSSA